MKELIIKNLEIISSSEVPYKQKYYKKAIKHLQAMSDLDIVERSSFEDLEGIGKSINKKILEMKQSNKNLNTVDELLLRSDKNQFNLLNVYGIGKALKAKIIKAHGDISSIDELMKIDDEHKILNQKQRIGLKYYDDLLSRIPRNEMIKHDELIAKAVINKPITYEITGSYRRMSESSGDIDILLTCSDSKDHVQLYKDFVNSFIEIGYITDVLAYGNSKFMGICRLNHNSLFRRIDIIVTTPDHYYFELLYFTGNDDFNKEMRGEALKQGYSLSQYNIVESKSKKPVDSTFKSEKDIFDFLSIQYLSPQERLSNSIKKISKDDHDIITRVNQLSLDHTR